MIRICGIVTEKNPNKCLKAISTAKKFGAELVELRIDFLDNPRDATKIISASNLPLIATNRNQADGGMFKGREEDMISILMDAIDRWCEFVDIELKVKEKLRNGIVSSARKNKCKVIVSTHDFKKTPDIQALIELMNEEREIADIGKIITFGGKVEDTIRIFNLLIQANSINFPLIAFVMGRLCSFSRIVAPLFGSYLTYAPVGQPLASGQLRIKEMVNVYKQLGVKI